MSLKTDKRAKDILRLLLRQGKASVDDLTAALGTSPASIRRDLTRVGRARAGASNAWRAPCWRVQARPCTSLSASTLRSKCVKIDLQPREAAHCPCGGGAGSRE